MGGTPTARGLPAWSWTGNDGWMPGVEPIPLNDMTRVLIVDHDRKEAEQLAHRLRICDATLCSATADTADKAALIASEFDVSVVVIDLASDLNAGLQAARRIADSCTGHVPILVGFAADEAGVRRVQDAHLFDYALRKPVRVAGLLGLIEKAEASNDAHAHAAAAAPRQATGGQE